MCRARRVYLAREGPSACRCREGRCWKGRCLGQPPPSQITRRKHSARQRGGALFLFHQARVLHGSWIFELPRQCPTKRRKKTEHCWFVPGCNLGYRSSKEKTSLFRAPACKEQFEKWARAIPRADRQLQENSAVCKKHFDARYVVHCKLINFM